jgi:hypothetical protein
MLLKFDQFNFDFSLKKHCSKTQWAHRAALQWVRIVGSEMHVTGLSTVEHKSAA